MAVEYITYKEEKLPVKIGYYVLKMMQKKHDANLEEIQGDIALYEPFLFFALEQGHKVEGIKMKYKLADMVDILDDCFFEFVQTIPKFFPTELGEVMAATGKKKK